MDSGGEEEPRLQEVAPAISPRSDNPSLEGENQGVEPDFGRFLSRWGEGSVDQEIEVQNYTGIQVFRFTATKVLEAPLNPWFPISHIVIWVKVDKCRTWYVAERNWRNRWVSFRVVEARTRFDEWRFLSSLHNHIARKLIEFEYFRELVTKEV